MTVVQLGNAVTEGKQIVIGMSSTQLIGAAMYAFSNIPRATAGQPVWLLCMSNSSPKQLLTSTWHV